MSCGIMLILALFFSGLMLTLNPCSPNGFSELSSSNSSDRSTAIQIVNRDVFYYRYGNRIRDLSTGAVVNHILGTIYRARRIIAMC